MKTGELVKIQRATIGLCAGTLALLTKKLKTYDRPYRLNGPATAAVWEVLILNGARAGIKRRYLCFDMEKVC